MRFHRGKFISCVAQVRGVDRQTSVIRVYWVSQPVNHFSRVFVTLSENLTDCRLRDSYVDEIASSAASRGNNLSSDSIFEITTRSTQQLYRLSELIIRASVRNDPRNASTSIWSPHYLAESIYPFVILARLQVVETCTSRSIQTIFRTMTLSSRQKISGISQYIRILNLYLKTLY